MNINLNIEDNGMITSHEVDVTILIEDLARLVTRDLHKKFKLIFDGKNILEEYKNCSIQDTDLYDLATLSIIKYDLRDMFLSQKDEEIVFFKLNEKMSAFLRSKSSVFHILQSFRFYCKCIIPFNIIGEKYLHDFEIISDDECQKLKSKINSSSDSYFYDIKYSDTEKFEKEQDQIQSDLFVHDHVFKEKIIADDYFNREMAELIDDALISTGSVIAGSYVLSRIIGGFEVNDIDIFSYSLDFLRIFLKTALEKKLCPKIEYNRHDRLDSYKISFNEKFLNFVHIGDQSPEDVSISSDDNRSKTIKFILEDFDIMACATCYDGEKIYMNRLTLEKKSHIRLTNVSRYEKYLSRGFELIFINGMKATLLTERHGYEKPTTKIQKPMTFNLIESDTTRQIRFNECDLLSDIYDEIFIDSLDWGVLRFGDKIVPNINLKIGETSLRDQSVIAVC